MTISGIDFVVYEVSDLAQAVGFYRDIVGLKLDHVIEEGDWAEFEVGNMTLALAGPKVARWGVPYGGKTGADGAFKGEGVVALAVDDLKAAVQELKAKGVRFALEFADSTVCYFAVFTDPDGNRLWLHQRYAH